MSNSPKVSGDEAFIGDEMGGIDGEVLEDLDTPGGAEASDDEDAGEAGGDGEMIEDDSLHTFEGHTDAVLAVCWNPARPDMVATGGQDDMAFIWRVGQTAYEETAGSLSTMELAGHTDSVVSVAFNTSGTILATGAMDGTVRTWNANTGQLLHALEGPGGAVEWIRWHPRGDVVIAGGEDYTLWMWNAASGVCMQVFSGHSSPITAGGFTPDGKWVVSVSAEGDSSLRVWNPRTGECTLTLQGHGFHEEGICSLGLHQDSSAVISGGIDGSVHLANIQTGRVLGSLTGHEESVEAVGFSRHLPLAASAGVEGKLLIWDVATLSQRGLCEHPEAVTRMSWHPQQPLVATGCLDGLVRCWDLRTNACVRTWGGHAAGVQDVAFSADGTCLLSGADDNTARVFSMA